MYSNLPPTATRFESSGPLPLPMVEGTVWAGFPSPAADFAVKRCDLNDLMVTHPAATFFWHVRGTSMVDAGISDGDLLVVNRALAPQHMDVVVAEVDGEFTVKHFCCKGGAVSLRAANPTFPPLLLKEGQTLTICGVVTYTVRKMRP
uniref:Peptidase S24 LexA-like n=2 Tax=Polaromonas sp. H6N TaxID=1840293 RepID=A0A2S1FI73_9BURK|nr:peptidase S24 LexA-like [Polaromonas sp. H6N]